MVHAQIENELNERHGATLIAAASRAGLDAATLERIMVQVSDILSRRPFAALSTAYMNTVLFDHALTPLLLWACLQRQHPAVTLAAAAVVSSTFMPLKPVWPDPRRPLSTDARIAFRRQLHGRSLDEQEAAWKALAELNPRNARECNVELRAIEREKKRIFAEAPSSTWYDNARTTPAAAGGEWPPGRYDGTMMIRAKGEKHLSPPQMIVGSGHSYDAYLASYEASRTPGMLDDDGYRGSIIYIYDLHRDVRRLMRSRAPADKDRGSSNVLTDVNGRFVA
ncbi:MAG TPA: hypothetical protein VF624_01330 [Tepidisphaeraceae bacterium]|jgi:hypothetical protein